MVIPNTTPICAQFVQKTHLKQPKENSTRKLPPNDNPKTNLHKCTRWAHLYSVHISPQDTFHVVVKQFYISILNRNVFRGMLLAGAKWSDYGKICSSFKVKGSFQNRKRMQNMEAMSLNQTCVRPETGDNVWASVLFNKNNYVR